MARSPASLAFVLGALIGTGAAAAAATPSPVPHASPTLKSLAPDAPADRYFGPLKMSALQVRYKIQFLHARTQYHQVEPQDVLHDARLIEASLDAWAAAYPADRWLPQTSFALAQLYADVPLAESRERAVRRYQRTAALYARSTYAARSKSALANGVPQAAAYATVSPTPSSAPENPPPPSPVASATATATVAPR